MILCFQYGLTSLLILYENIAIPTSGGIKYHPELG